MHLDNALIAENLTLMIHNTILKHAYLCFKFLLVLVCVEGTGCISLWVYCTLWLCDGAVIVMLRG